jgi:hypothetical protein
MQGPARENRRVAHWVGCAGRRVTNYVLSPVGTGSESHPGDAGLPEARPGEPPDLTRSQSPQATPAQSPRVASASCYPLRIRNHMHNTSPSVQ